MRARDGGGSQPYAGGGWGRLDQWPSARMTPGELTALRYRHLLHPVAWLRWRYEIRRDGPYAPDFAEFRRQHRRRS